MLTFGELRHAGRQPEVPCDLQLSGDVLRIDQWLRVLPGKRYVGKGYWQGRQVLAKLMVGSHAHRDYQRECTGTALLNEQGLATPSLLAHGCQPATGGWLLFDFLTDATSLEANWQAVASQPLLSSAQESILGQALQAIGALHAKGLWQEDLHLGNLLCDKGQIVWVDCGSVRGDRCGQQFEGEEATANLGVFLAQFPADIDAFIGKLLPYYRRGGGRVELPPEELHGQITKARRWRLSDFLGKTGRDCTLFSVRRGPMELSAVRRSELVALQPLLAAPDRHIEAGDILKDGHSSTVARVVIAGRPLVVKRYNIKGIAHWLRRCWRPSRAWHAWREGHRLAFLGLLTPPPLAMLEYRCYGLRRRAYLILEYLEGENIRGRFAPYVDTPPPDVEMAALISLFQGLVRERISHGDLKGTNLIWHGDRWQLIDLDAVRQHKTARCFAKAYARDRARFLRNWPTDSVLHKLLDARLPGIAPQSSDPRG